MPAPRRITSGNVKKLEKLRTARETLNFELSPQQSSVLPRVPLRASAVPKADIRRKRNAVAHQTNTQITFVNTMQAAKARVNNVLRGQNHDQETQEIHIDNSSDDETTARGRVEKREVADINLRTPPRPLTQPGHSIDSASQAPHHSEVSKSVARKIDGFGSPYKLNDLDCAAGGRSASKATRVQLADDITRGQALTPSRIIDRMRPRTHRESDETKQKSLRGEDADSPEDVESKMRGQTNGASSRASKVKMAESFMRVLRSPSQESKGTRRRQSICSTVQTKTTPPSTSNRRKSITPKKQGASIPSKKLPLLGVQIGKYIERTDGLSGSRAEGKMLITIRYTQKRLELQGLRGGGEHMIIDTCDIALMEHMSYNGLAILRITPTDGMENIFDQRTFDPSSSEPNISTIYLCLEVADKDNTPISRLVTVFKEDTRVMSLDPAIYREYVHEFTKPFSVDLISSDEEGLAAKTHLQSTAKSIGGMEVSSDTAQMCAATPQYWSSIDNKDTETSARNSRSTDIKCGESEGVATYGKRKQQITLLDSGSAGLTRRASTLRYKLRKTRNSSMSEGSFLTEDNSDEDDFVVQHREFSSEDHSLRFEYPRGGPKAISVTGSDISRLYHGEFLNDTILEFYMRYIAENLRSADPALYEQCFFFNTFFFKKLSQRSKGVLSDPEISHVDTVYKRLRKWTANVELFDKRYIFVPIHENTHWYLAIIVNSEAMLYGDSGSVCESDTSKQKDAKASENVFPVEKNFTSSTDLDAVVAGSSKKLRNSCSTDSCHIKDATSDSNGESDTLELHATDRDGDVRMGDVANLDHPVRSITGCSEQLGLNEVNDTDKHKPVVKLLSCDAIDHSGPENKQQFNASIKSSPPAEDHVKPATIKLELMGITADVHSAKYVDPLDTPAIIILDSLGNRHQQTFGLLRAYMRAEANSRRNADLSQTLQLGKYAKVPLQNNFCDCGIYLLQYVEEFLKNPHAFTALALNGVNMRSMFTSAKMQQKRYDVLSLAKSLAEDHKGQLQLPDHSDANHSVHDKEHDSEEGCGSPASVAEPESTDASTSGAQDDSSAASMLPHVATS
ncbi:cysteine proteinase [Coemansia reversa NRRL 1564]|uniref:Cysteine proteinase n=1 Tax=Coemansia reversa (strain ATCC 12441 / NRRL 1564) TaxID=763665 RepID=A0A2G5BBC8_COERN|nr:cysteine proteinase [Coemansia reversa NRRL 1564]|eukprot:PIA16313.1 cysteine proteinase [Coemansia reversa NRRL 1564]